MIICYQAFCRLIVQNSAIAEVFTFGSCQMYSMSIMSVATASFTRVAAASFAVAEVG